MEFLSGDKSGMARAIGAFDWASTSMGPIETWPMSLLAIVRMMLQQRHAICIFWGPELALLYNDAYRPFLGAKEKHALGKPFSVIWSEIWDDVKPFADKALSGEGTYSEDMRLVMNRNGFEEETFWTFSYSPLFDDDIQVAGIINVTVDTTALVKGRREQELLRRELVHRVKNTMAVTTAVVSATMRNAETLEQARNTISRRIAALGQAQDLIHHSGHAAEVVQIVNESLKAHTDDPKRVIVSGPPLRICAQQAVGLSLAVYELATNALKYGALSNDAGTVNIVWAAGPDRKFHFSWREAGGPSVKMPSRSGFGSRLCNQIIASYFSGTGETTYDVEGLRFELAGTYREDDDV